MQTLCSDLLLAKRTQIPDHLITASRRRRGDLGLLLLDAATFVGNEVLDLLLYVGPIEPGSC